MLDKLASDEEIPLDLGIDDEVHIPLAVTQLLVLESVSP